MDVILRYVTCWFQGITRLVPSNNDYDWLGSGIYFWENNSLRALNFATELKNTVGRNSRIEKPAVVGAIALKDTFFLWTRTGIAQQPEFTF